MYNLVMSLPYFICRSPAIRRRFPAVVFLAMFLVGSVLVATGDTAEHSSTITLQGVVAPRAEVWLGAVQSETSTAMRDRPGTARLYSTSNSRTGSEITVQSANGNTTTVPLRRTSDGFPDEHLIEFSASETLTVYVTVR